MTLAAHPYIGVEILNDSFSQGICMETYPPVTRFEKFVIKGKVILSALAIWQKTFFTPTTDTLIHACIKKNVCQKKEFLNSYHIYILTHSKDNS